MDSSIILAFIVSSSQPAFFSVSQSSPTNTGVAHSSRKLCQDQCKHRKAYIRVTLNCSRCLNTYAQGMSIVSGQGRLLRDCCLCNVGSILHHIWCGRGVPVEPIPVSCSSSRMIEVGRTRSCHRGLGETGFERTRPAVVKIDWGSGCTFHVLTKYGGS